jgi:hypothetical protein
MESTCTLSAATLGPVQSWAEGQTDEWHVRTPYLNGWLSQASRLLGPSRVGDVVLSYDPAVRLVSLDVYCNGDRVFGMDDLV